MKPGLLESLELCTERALVKKEDRASLPSCPRVDVGSWLASSGRPPRPARGAHQRPFVLIVIGSHETGDPDRGGQGVTWQAQPLRGGRIVCCCVRPDSTEVLVGSQRLTA
jgi:hypothetical protein